MLLKVIICEKSICIATRAGELQCFKILNKLFSVNQQCAHVGDFQNSVT